MFASQFEDEEKSFSNRKSIIATVVTFGIHGLILLALIFTILRTPIPPFEDNAGGMSVNFGTDDVGMGDEQPFTYNPGPTASTPPPAQQQSQPPAGSPDDVLSQDDEESEVTAPKVEKPKNKINEEAVLKPNKQVNTPAKTNKPSKTDAPPAPQADPNAIFQKGAPGTPNNSKGDGTGDRPGDQGRPGGDPNSRNYLGDGDGDGDGPGQGDLKGKFSLAGRKRISAPVPTGCNTTGKVVVKIKVDRNGRVTEASVDKLRSTTLNECNTRDALNSARQNTFNASSTSAEIQEGTITYIYEVK